MLGAPYFALPLIAYFPHQRRRYTFDQKRLIELAWRELFTPFPIEVIRSAIWRGHPIQKNSSDMLFPNEHKREVVYVGSEASPDEIQHWLSLTLGDPKNRSKETLIDTLLDTDWLRLNEVLFGAELTPLNRTSLTMIALTGGLSALRKSASRLWRTAALRTRSAPSTIRKGAKRLYKGRQF